MHIPPSLPFLLFFLYRMPPHLILFNLYLYSGKYPSFT